ncbi:pyridoxal phosphate-dependent aminotransferase [Deinococcus cellulosilyticus]|uniref:Aminotransferase n=1 Tax=Deinococcus cellulosilyticus (strain DSM 18568 / NBRC 106333 / KACC 11606 / 5516J-15) TaxID=1223518 RepID=A0A511N9C1_DEIC1|nr:aminotransferase class I/II-fold pyridoxal phosphate-dependent enzyme [Deinococcus cellulosilyticus]GEM49400.1 aminotransferase [Deinococcus cellulosilyticus NBRC 106333 = KACC 11606]
MRELNPVLQTFRDSPFTQMTLRAMDLGAVNLGQGFPDHAPPAFVQEALRESFSGPQQYAPVAGLMTLREELAQDAEKRLGLKLNPATEVTITAGATEAVQGALQGILQQGDEVIVLEPTYDMYAPQVKLAGGIPVFVALRFEGGYQLDVDALKAAITEKTRVIILNTPHNPTGKVFTRAELQAIADLALVHDLYVISDEVYDRLTFEVEHLCIHTLEGMQERTITVGSAGKTFAVTGWRVGWAFASERLTKALRGVHQWVSFCAPSPLQHATMLALKTAQTFDYSGSVQQGYIQKRDFLSASLKDAGFPVYQPEGGYFVVADVSHLGLSEQAACDWMLTEVGVASIPMGVFYNQGGSPFAGLRFAFCKGQETLEQAAERLYAGCKVL